MIRSNHRKFHLGLCATILFCTCAFAGLFHSRSSDAPRLHLTFDNAVKGTVRCVETQEECLATPSPIRLLDGALHCGGDQKVSLPHCRALNIKNSLTLAVWIAPTERPRGYQTLLYKGKRQGDFCQDIQFLLSLHDGRPEFKFKDQEGKWCGIMRNADRFVLPGGKIVPLKEIPAAIPRRWQHVAATFDNGAIVVYFNGKKVLSASETPQQLVLNKHDLLIGEAQNQSGTRGQKFRGLLDDVRIYARALDATEIATLATTGEGGRDTGDLVIPAFLPEGYDPDFKTTLKLVEDYQASQSKRQPTTVESASVARHNGVVDLRVNGKPVYPMAMLPEPYVTNERITKSCHDFAAAGVNLYSEIFWSWMTIGNACHSWWLGEGKYDFDIIDARIRAIIAADPTALIFPRVKLNPPNWWLKAHPDHITLGEDGKSAKQASLASPAWEAAYERMLRDFIRHAEQSDYAKRIIGYHPAGGSTSEWFWWGKQDVVDFSPAAIARWRDWLRKEYQNDVSRLQKAWGNPKASFETARPPSRSQHREADQFFFRHPVKQRQVVDYYRFLSAMVSRNIIRSCRIVKEETKGKKIAGVFYGYSVYCMQTYGFHGLAEVLASDSVDFLCAPTAYDRRRGGEAGNFISAYNGSHRLHNTLYWDEVDSRTHLCPTFVHYRFSTLEETLGCHRRAFGYSLTRGTALWWFLLAGNATFHQDAIMDDIAKMVPIAQDALQADRRPTAQVAVFIDEPSMLYTPRSKGQFHRALLRQTLDELTCMGAPFDLYLLSDINHPNLPDYQLYIFPNAFQVPDKLRRSIAKTVRRDGRTAAWIYAPGYLTDTGFSESSMADLTGITLRAEIREASCQLRTTKRHAITRFAGKTPTAPLPVGPIFQVDDPQAKILGTVEGKPALCVKELENWNSVYSLMPLNRDLLLGLCRYAGVHVYSESLDPFSANQSYLMLHAAKTGRKTITLPQKMNVQDVFTGELVGKHTKRIRLHTEHGQTQILKLLPAN